MRALLVIASICVAHLPAAADSRNPETLLVGPLFGIRLGGPDGPARGILGIEGGVGRGVHRLNLGFELRDTASFGYIEYDPWYLLGYSLGLGVDTNGEVHPVAGVWEGMMFSPGERSCSQSYPLVTAAIGYRFAGVHEIYLTVKGGTGEGCWF